MELNHPSSYFSHNTSPKAGTQPDVYAVVYSVHGDIIAQTDGAPITRKRIVPRSGERDALDAMASHQLRNVHLDQKMYLPESARPHVSGPAYLYSAAAGVKLGRSLDTFSLTDLIEHHADIVASAPSEALTLQARRNLKLYQHVLRLCLDGQIGQMTD